MILILDLYTGAELPDLRIGQGVSTAHTSTLHCHNTEKRGTYCSKNTTFMVI